MSKLNALISTLESSQKKQNPVNAKKSKNEIVRNLNDIKDGLKMLNANTSVNSLNDYLKNIQKENLFKKEKLGKNFYNEYPTIEGLCVSCVIASYQIKSKQLTQVLKNLTGMVKSSKCIDMINAIDIVINALKTSK